MAKKASDPLVDLELEKPVGMMPTGVAAAVRSRAGAHDPGAGASAIPRPVLVPVAKKKKKRSEADLLR